MSLEKYKGLSPLRQVQDGITAPETTLLILRNNIGPVETVVSEANEPQSCRVLLQSFLNPNIYPRREKRDGHLDRWLGDQA